VSAQGGEDRRRVAITGLGLVTPLGIGADENWRNALAGKSGIGRPSEGRDPDLPVKVVGEVPGFEATDFITKKLTVRSDRNTHFSFAACQEALADAGLDPEQEDKQRVGLVLASNYGGTSYYLENLERLHQKGPSFVSAYMATAWIPSAPVGQLSIFYGFTGYSKTLVNDSAGGLDAIGAGYAAIRRGDSDVIIAGGFEAALADTAMVAIATFDQVCRDAPEPARAFRPFNSERLGIVVAEGGAIVLLEELERARARGATVYAEVCGFAQTSDAVHLERFAEDGEQYARAMRLALGQAGVEPGDVDYVSAEGRATPEGDRSEARAILRGLDGRGPDVPVSAPKSMTGNSLAGAGAIDTAFAALALRGGVIPPTINIEQLDPELGLNVVANEPLRTELTTVLVLARGTGGVNSALVLRRLDDTG
jgi:3-oxoacyl-[acyl-carrier-protein] synthase II